MVSHYAPLNLQGVLHDLLLNYGHILPQFDGTWVLTAQQHVEKLNDFIDLEQVDHEGAKIRLFAQFFLGEVKK